MKIKNEKELFDLYVEKDNPLRQALEKPFINEKDGRVWASDGFMLLIVDRESVTGEYETSTIGNNLSLREYNCDIPLFVSDLQGALDQCPKEDKVLVKTDIKDCPECAGTGIVYLAYTAAYNGKRYSLEAECPICKGIGVIRNNNYIKTGKRVVCGNVIIKFCDNYCRAQQIETLVRTCRMLSVDSIRLVRTGYKEIAIFELTDDIHVCISPMVVDDRDKGSSMIIIVEKLQR